MSWTAVPATPGDKVAGARNSGATPAIDLTAGETWFPVAITADCTFAFQGADADGVSSFLLDLTYNGVHTVAWPSSVKWAAGTAPTLSAAAGKRDLLSFLSRDGGATWLGFSAGIDLR